MGPDSTQVSNSLLIYDNLNVIVGYNAAADDTIRVSHPKLGKTQTYSR